MNHIGTEAYLYLREQDLTVISYLDTDLLNEIGRRAGIFSDRNGRTYTPKRVQARVLNELRNDSRFEKELIEHTITDRRGFKQKRHIRLFSIKEGL